jgi:hypothetical protein
VDVYDAGHVHSYEVSWPQLGGETTAFNYTNPTGIVYITEGNGAKNVLFAPFIYKMHYFTKTGSGQT